jgi:23S rRNA pseudouridine2605 synthase
MEHPKRNSRPGGKPRGFVGRPKEGARPEKSWPKKADARPARSAPPSGGKPRSFTERPKEGVRPEKSWPKKENARPVRSAPPSGGKPRSFTDLPRETPLPEVAKPRRVPRPKSAPPVEGVRLQKVISAAGIASRRKAELLMAEGRVLVNGVPVVNLGTRVNPATDRIEVDGAKVATPGNHLYLLMHKPAGTLTTVEDDRGRKTVMDLLKPKFHRVFPVGRLDRDTTGVLLLTTDGDLAFRLLHPRYGVRKVYRVQVEGRMESRTVDSLLAGVPLTGEDRPAVAVTARIIKMGARSTELEMTIHEGRKRVVRRMLGAVGHKVTKLSRTRFGPLTVGDLAPGTVRPLTEAELEALVQESGL